MKDCIGFTTEDVVAILRSMKPPTMLRDGKSTTHIMQTVAIEYAINAIEERNTGKWYCDMYGVFRCSSCGKSAHLDSRGRAWLDRYCSWCGAEMEVDE